LANSTQDPILLRFPSGQSYDVQLFDENGKNVYTWSADKAFTMIFRQEALGPGTRTYAFSVSLGTLPPGRYRVRGWLTTEPPQYAAETSFRIDEVRISPARRR